MFFPLMKALDLDGWVDLVYFPPNNWECRDKKPKYLYLLYSDGLKWKSIFIDTLLFDQNKFITTKDFSDIFKNISLALIYPSPIKLGENLDSLPNFKTWHTDLPAWRASSGFKNDFSQVSYQSDLDPLPEQGTLLTFHPFIQFGQLKNYLIVLNAQSNPVIKTNDLLIFDSKTKQFINSTKIATNSVTSIDLDQYSFKKTDLPIFISTGMPAVPFGLGISNDSRFMSLEHTHPPGSFVVRGDRNKIQKTIKTNWFEQLKVDQYARWH